MAYQLFQLPKQLNIATGSFSLAAGAKAYFYATTTTTPQDTYTTSALSTPHPNPVVADAAGVLPAIYLDPSKQYKLTLNTSADVLIYTVDPINDQLLTQSIIAQLMNPQTSAEAGVGLAVTDYSVPSHEVDGIERMSRYGFETSGVAAANTGLLHSAVDLAAALTGSYLALGVGTYPITNITVDENGVVLGGATEGSTILRYDSPVGDTVALTFSKGASSVVRSGLSNVGFVSSSSSTKTAIKLNDARQPVMERISINSGNWPGTDSIGIRAYGRDFWNLRDSDIECARPLVISPNPNAGTLNTDQWRIDNVQLASTASTGKCIEVETGAEITRFSLSNMNLAGGKYGFYWSDSTSTISSYGLDFYNVNTEQAADATGYSFYIESTGAQRMKDVAFRKCIMDPGRGGLFARKCNRITLQDCEFPGTGTNLDITFDSTTELVVINTHIQVGSTVTLTNAVLVEGGPFNPSETVIPKNAVYRYDEGAVVSQKTALEYNSKRRWTYSGTLANNATLNTPCTRAAYSSCVVSVSAYSATGPVKAGGSATWFQDGTTTKIGGTANFVVAAAGAEIRCLDGGSGLVIVNTLGQSVALMVAIDLVP